MASISSSIHPRSIHLLVHLPSINPLVLLFIYLAPDIHIDGTLSAVHLMLDKRQLEIIKGLIDMNLGEQIEEFEKPSTIIHDPVAQVIKIHCHHGNNNMSFSLANGSSCLDGF